MNSDQMRSVTENSTHSRSGLYEIKPQLLGHSLGEEVYGSRQEP